MAASMMLHLHIVYLSLWINVICGQTLTDTKQLLKSVSLSIGSKESIALVSIKDGVQMFLFDIGMDCLIP
jgi:flagellar biogenesis protein FliO